MVEYTKQVKKFNKCAYKNVTKKGVYEIQFINYTIYHRWPTLLPIYPRPTHFFFLVEKWKMSPSTKKDFFSTGSEIVKGIF